MVAGYLINSSNGPTSAHGFLRSAKGTYTTFDVDVTGDAAGTTYAYSINNNAEITGTYVDTSGVQHGYVRSP
jgi:hypothetical protein